PDGGFFIAKGGQQQKGTLGKHNGTVISISPDGRRTEVVATGFRQPYLGMNPRTGLLTASDQQGNYVPSTPIDLIKKGAFYGFKQPAPDAAYPPVTEPAIWIPHHIIQSGTGQVWTLDKRMGPLAGHMLQLDYTRGMVATAFLDGEQGAVYRLPIAFPAAL